MDLLIKYKDASPAELEYHMENARIFQLLQSLKQKYPIIKPFISNTLFSAFGRDEALYNRLRMRLILNEWTITTPDTYRSYLQWFPNELLQDIAEIIYSQCWDLQSRGNYLPLNIFQHENISVRDFPDLFKWQ